MTARSVSLISPYPALHGSHHAGSSGVASYTANLARALRDRGTDVHVVAPVDEAGPVVESDEGIMVERCFAPTPRGVRAAADAVLAADTSVAHLQFELFLYGGPAVVAGLVPTLAAMRRRGRATVVTLHQAVEPGEVDRSYTALHRVPVPPAVARVGIGSVQWAMSKAATATVVHEEQFRQVIPSAAVVPHGIERVARGDRPAARARLGLDEHRLVALCFGFVSPYKGLETALDATRLAGPGVQCVVAGGEHPRLASVGDDYAARLRAAYPEARFTGWVPGERVTDWFRAADVALFPYPRPFSASGALSLALANGTPILLSPPMARCIGAPTSVVAHGEQHLADRLRRLASDPEHRASLRRVSDGLASGRHWDQVADRHRALYGEVAA